MGENTTKKTEEPSLTGAALAVSGDFSDKEECGDFIS